MTNVTTAPKDERVWFPQMLRGAAALLVVGSHYLDLFWRHNADAVALTHADPVAVSLTSPIFGILGWASGWSFNLGPFGVALFFLISGFVIPFSLKKSGVAQFLTRRIFRIYPTYWAGLAVTVLALWLYSITHARVMPVSLRDMLINASLLRDWVWTETINGVNWTLETELKFYLLCAFLTLIADLRKPRTLLVTAMCLCAFNLAVGAARPALIASYPLLYSLLAVVSIAAGYLIFMFIGTCFYNLYRGHWSARTFALTTALLCGGFILAVGASENQSIGTFLLVNYTLALLIFGIIYRLRDRLRYSRLLDFLANISYPLYVVHAVPGYVLLTILYGILPNPLIDVALTFALIVPVAYLLHRYIEVPSNRMGRRAAGRIGGHRAGVKSARLA